MKRLMLLSFVAICLSLSSEWVDLAENSHKQLFETIYSDELATDLEFSLNGFEKTSINANGQSYQRISYWNEGQFLEIGKPDLPRFTRLIAIPNEGTVSVDIISFQKEVLSDILVYPQQELLSESQPNRKEFTIDDLFYSSTEIFPKNMVEIGEPAIMRDLRVVSVTVNPFQYNPGTRELAIFTEFEIVVSCHGSSGINQKSEDKSPSRSFESTYKSSVINYNSESMRDDEFHQPNYLFIYPDDPQVESTLQNLIEWKRQKGFQVVASNTSQTGSTQNSIKNYIQNAYDTWENPPEFICLVGDAGGNFSIPTGHMDGGEGDQVYVLLEGNDILADAFIGRLSFNSISELQTIIYKILKYEKEPYLNNINWYNQALLVGDPTSSGQSCIDTKINVKDMMSQYSNNFTFTEVYSSPWVSQMTTAFNEGVSYFNYRGYYGMSGWTNSNIDALNNGFMLPVAVLLTCSVGDFEGTFDSRTERFLKAGSPGNPRGAVAAIGTATSDTNTCFNNCVDAGIYYGIFTDEIFHLGGALNRGKLNLTTSYPNNPYNAIYKFSYWNNLMGDPGMEIWTGIPQQMMVTYESQLPIGSNFFNVRVTEDTGLPIKNAWVTILRDDEIFSTGYTDDNGWIFLPIEADNPGEVNLTVTKHDFIPFIGTFNIIQNDVFINVFEIQIDDDNVGSSSGNGDNIINPGEQIELRVSLKNFGTLPANSVSATITSDSNFITITDNIESYGTIPAGVAAFSSDDFDFSIDANVLGGSELIFDLLIQDNENNAWNDQIYLNIEGANLQPIGYTILDGNNGILEPGEIAEILFTIENSGIVDAEEVFGFLTCPDEQITIEDPDGYFGDIPSGGQTMNSNNSFILSTDSQIIPGTRFTLDLQLFNSSGYDNVVSPIIDVGDVSITDPLGPDSYGYYCYDDGDVNYSLHPEYSWVEIDPAYGGQGTVITLNDNGDMGDSENIDLPFILKFYGNNYTTITVCSNGWIAPGGSESLSFMNWSIPGPNGPSPIIAPFWDDLKTANGHVCYFYDQTENRFIVEWSHLQNDYNNAEETFQTILYDTNFYPTSTGDNKILFQYETINNIDQGSYGPNSNHGEYATVGLEDHTGTIGLEYTYSNQYPVSAKVLEDEMTILFTTPPIPDQGPFIMIDSFEINDDLGNNNGIVNPGETIALSITLKNIGNETAANVSALISSEDLFTTIIEDSQFFEDLLPNTVSTSLDNYTFTVETICPDQHDIVFVLNITADGDYEWNNSLVIEVLSPEIATSTAILDFEEIYVGYPDSLNLIVYNNGSEILYVSDIFSNNPNILPDLSSFSLNGNASLELIISVNTNIQGTINDTLFILSNDPDEPQIDIAILGETSLPPVILTSVNSLNIQLEPGDTLTQYLTLENIGGSDLEFDIEIMGAQNSGMAANFDGIDDYMDIVDNVINTNYFTIEMWALMMGQGGGPRENNPIFEQRDDVAVDSHSAIVFFAQVNTYRTYLFIRSSSGSACITETDCQPYGVWKHYAGVVTPTMIYYYINGVIVDSTTNVQQGNYTTSIDYVDLGKHTYSGYTHAYFNGLLDEVRIWDHPLTNDDILTNMNNSLLGSEAGLQAYWNFDEVNPWLDLTGNGYDGIPYGDLNIADSSAPINSWITVNPKSGFISDDSSLDIEIFIDATLLDIGIYYADIIIHSNDPANPEIIIPVMLNIVEVSTNELLSPFITKLENNYPNPFNIETIIEYQISDANIANLQIYNIKGQLVKTLINKKHDAGKYRIIWNGTDNNDKKVSTGIYVLRFEVGNKVISNKKCLLLK
ncbi:MAG: C25 family cysteine peptidase [Candidatus Cloacimonadales bacterium]|nr:C25 family cysteine peptidase [Candidatus Cloacimonadales bacterium]